MNNKKNFKIEVLENATLLYDNGKVESFNAIYLNKSGVYYGEIFNKIYFKEKGCIPLDNVEEIIGGEKKICIEKNKIHK